jgi:hypothetical protein
VIAEGIVQIPAEAEVAFGGEDGGVAEGKLNLFERGASLVGEFGKGTAKVVGASLGTLKTDLLFRL